MGYAACDQPRVCGCWVLDVNAVTLIVTVAVTLTIVEVGKTCIISAAVDVGV
jgi:hypothetical protein